MDFFTLIFTQMLSFLHSLSVIEAYLFIFTLLLICGFGFPLPEDITLIAAGITASLGKISFGGALAISFLGIMLGDSITFFIGRYLKDRAFDLPLVRRIKKKKIEYAKKKVQSNAYAICFIARFLPGLRALTYLTAGVLRVKPMIFFLTDGFAALISVPVWVYLGWLVGNNVPKVLEYANQFQEIIFISMFVFIVCVVAYKYRDEIRAKFKAV